MHNLPVSAPILVYENRSVPHASRPRTPALQRPKLAHRCGLRLTQRDAEIIHAVCAFRALTAPQIHKMFFAGDDLDSDQTVSSRCRYRLKLLFQHGYLFRDAPPTKYNEGRKPLVYFLDRAAIPLLAERYGLSSAEIDWHPRRNDVTWPFLSHLLHTNDVRIAVTQACRRSGVRLLVWHDERQLKSHEMKDYVTLPVHHGRRRVAVVPDAYFRLVDARYRYHQFLEMDMSTETVGAWGHGANRKTFAQKIAAYVAYYQSGQYTRRYGSRAIRVLVITTSAARLNNLWSMANQVAGISRDLFWFTTLDQVSSQSIFSAPIWRVGQCPDALALLDGSRHGGSGKSSLGAHQPPLPTSPTWSSPRHNPANMRIV